MRCSSKASNGCLLAFCARNTGYECKAQPGAHVNACANDIVRFNSVTVGRTEVMFHIDLNAPPLSVDYYFLIDTSDTIAKDIQKVKNKIVELTEMYRGMANVRFAVGQYKSEENLRDGWAGVTNFTNNIGLVQFVTNRLTTSGGTNMAQANLAALTAAHRLGGPWNDKARKNIIYFGNLPGHEQSRTKDLGILTRISVTEELKKNSVVVIGVNTGSNRGLNSNTWSYPPGIEDLPAGQADHITTETGGVLVDLDMTLMDAI